MMAKVMVNLGSGRQRPPGFINVDSDPAVGADVTEDMVEYLRALEADSVDHIRAIHAIEHVDYRLVPEFFTLAHAALKPGGVMVLEWPDIAKIAGLIVKQPERLPIFARNIFGGYDGQHRFAWSPEMLVEHVKAAGFSRIDVSAGRVHGRPHRDSKITAYKDKGAGE